MKLKIQMVEGFHTTIWKKPIEIETDDYPELQGKSQNEIMEILNDDSSKLPASPGGDAEDWSMYDDLMDQETELQKEKNNEIFIEIWEQ